MDNELNKTDLKWAFWVSLGIFLIGFFFWRVAHAVTGRADVIKNDGKYYVDVLQLAKFFKENGEPDVALSLYKMPRNYEEEHSK